MAFDVGFVEYFYENSSDPVTTWPNSGTAVTWTVPNGVYWVWVKAIAGGGGGGSSLKSVSTTAGGGGGGAGESVEGLMIPVNPNGSLSIYVGGGGYYGQRTSPTAVLASNVHAGPEGSTAVDAGWGGEDTTIGPIRLKGGYGGLGSNQNNHGGMGGGPQAGPKGHNSGPLLSNNGDTIGGASGSGSYSTVKDCGRFWAGSGGGASANVGGTTGSGDGGDQGPFEGGTEGTPSGTISGGAGGGASVFGDGGDGGNVDASAPAVPSGSYGAGGGGAGGCSTTAGATSQAFLGARGGHGYVSLHYLIVTPTNHIMTTYPGVFTLTGNDVTFTYP